MTKVKNLLEVIISESKAYETFKDIEKLVEIGEDLSMVPIQPLYVSLINSPSSEVANILPRLSKDQRQSLVDLDFWNKDVVDVNSFEYWIEVYALNKETELTYEFVISDDFLLYLKSRVNIHTFDSEDPMYPDHDYYFLTDDNLLLVEYGEDFRYPNELKYLIRNLYDVLGVEGAYSKLFKLVNDSFSIIQEKSYQEKKERLRDYGFVDYFEAKESLYPFATYPQINRFIDEKKTATGNIDTNSQNQTLHSSALIGFNSGVENISKELELLDDEKRETYLQFNFVRMINSTVTVEDALRKGRVELSRVTKKAKVLTDLGVQYIRNYLGDKINNEQSVFSSFDFVDLNKIGASLFHIVKNKVKKNLSKSSFDKDENEYFLGVWWTSFLENTFLDIPKTKSFGAGLHTMEVSSMESFLFWKSEANTFCELIPYIEKFFQTLNELKNNAGINDDYYLNYEVKDIDFESILISSFINFSNLEGKIDAQNRMGISVKELKLFINNNFRKINDEYVINSEDSLMINDYLEKYGLDSVKEMDHYLYGILCEHLSGYEFDTLAQEDFEHVGGPILLNIKTSH